MSSTTLPRRSRLTPAARARSRAPIAVAGLAIAALVTGCRTTTTPSAAAFCRRVEANRSVLQGAGTDAAGVARTLAAYRNVAQVAPAGVRDAWGTVTALVESAASADLTVPQTNERLAARSLAAKPEIDSIVHYTKSTCGLDIAAAAPVTAPVPAPTAQATGDPAPTAPATGQPAPGDLATADAAAATDATPAIVEEPGTVPPTVAG